VPAEAPGYALLGEATDDDGDGMGRMAKRLAVLLAGLAVAVAAGSSPAAAGWPVIGTLKVWAAGIPGSLGAGGTVDLTINYSQDSRDTLSPWMFGVSLWDTNDPSADLGFDAFTASYLNPLTQQWQEATSSSGNGDRMLDISTSRPVLRVPPNTTASVRVKVTFGSAARAGVYRLQAMLPAIQLLASDGNSDPAILDYDWPQYDFRYGSAAPPAPPRATHPASGTRAPARTAAPVPVVPPVPSASPDGSPAPVPTASPAVSTSSVGPMVATVPVAGPEPRALSVWPYVGGVVAIVFLATGGYGLRRRRTKVSTSPATGTVSDVDGGGTPVGEPVQ
jgi:hypothetical protein